MFNNDWMKSLIGNLSIAYQNHYKSVTKVKKLNYLKYGLINVSTRHDRFYTIYTDFFHPQKFSSKVRMEVQTSLWNTGCYRKQPIIMQSCGCQFQRYISRTLQHLMLRNLFRRWGRKTLRAGWIRSQLWDYLLLLSEATIMMSH